ncbi:MAG: YgiT-type zinc finger domain-containing protein [Elusimicrobia bacterium CG_4_10_14_0_8_um_filter_37_32]|nr:MAG: YgiT-type zinc finger domain-containing protein [Elusimicrobia bacterium CG02_land_8_20_14_3_00_37_13]PIZ12594.1 MAG: YgiT-type zinc finger domain-containing protein [Elusimicrobia bacterium CG_4_10_14_0_8_um_filter_37_32]
MKKHVGGEYMNKSYKYDNCNFCGGRVSERRVQKACWWGEKLLAIVDNVPAGVCEQCGEKYYRAVILRQVENLIRNRKKLNKISVPLAEFVTR